jgi:Ca2+/Na+ antiporter
VSFSVDAARRHTSARDSDRPQSARVARVSLHPLFIRARRAFGLSHTWFKVAFLFFFFVLLFVSSSSRLMTEILFYIFHHLIINLNYFSLHNAIVHKPTCFVCCGASFSSSRWWWRGGLWDDSFVSIFTKIVDLSRRVFVFFLGVGSFSFRFVLMALFVLCYLFPVFYSGEN